MSEQTPVLLRQQQLAEILAGWMLQAVNSEPGWDRMVLELKPSADAMLMRITQDRGGMAAANAGALQPGTAPFDAAVELRSLSAGENGESWRSAAVNLSARDWPEPKYSLDTYFNFDQPAPDFGLGEPADQGPASAAGQEQAGRRGLDNRLVADAVTRFSENPGKAAAVNVLRHLIGSEVLLDATDNPGRPGISVVEVHGSPSVLAFTSQEKLAEFRASTGRPGAPVSWVQPGEELVKFVDGHRDIAYLYINPAGPACALGRPEIGFAAGSLANVDLKRAVASQSGTDAVAEQLKRPGAVVLTVDRPDEGVSDGGPILLKGQDGGPILPVFSSGPEVAAFRPAARFREVPATWAIDMLRQRPELSMVVDPAGPDALLRASDF
jgi:hypothetical protein